MSDNDEHHSDSSFEEADDQDWADWVDDDNDNNQHQKHNITYDPILSSSSVRPSDATASGSFKVPTRALFPTQGEHKVFDSPLAALSHDKEANGCDFVAVVKRLGLDALQVIRLVNHIRRNNISASTVNSLQGSEPFLNDDAELAPVARLEDDGLLQLDFDELSGQSDREDAAAGAIKNASSHQYRLEELEQELTAMRFAFEDLRNQYSSRIGLDGNTNATSQDGDGKLRASDTSPLAGSSRTHNSFSPSAAEPGKGDAPVRRDDDTHYFNSYASNDIHQTMLEDSVRTLSYAKFLLSPRNASFIRGKTIMDVGCGSGILSLFCARAGAKEVLAIDASDVADRARGNVDANGWGHVVKVKKGKLENLGEELKAYEGKVDLIVSEWMGYFLLYESMLPSVLVARDRYLNPSTGVLAPSHCRMLLAAVSDAELLQQRIKFWDNVHGFSMPAMSKGLEVDAYTEGLSADKVVTTVASVFDLPLQTMPACQPSFVAPFTLEVAKDTTIHGFINWFDTWFVPLPHPALPANSEGEANVTGELKGGQVIQDLPPVTTRPVTAADVTGISLQGREVQRGPTSEEEQAGGETVSFTTGPDGKETHWKQTVLILKEPLQVTKGTLITGSMHVVPSSINSRELDAELHWAVRQPEEHAARLRGELKKVETMTVQVWAVR